MKNYIDVYKEYLNSSFAAITTYRLNFFLLILFDLSFFVITFFTVHFMFDHIEQIGPWNKSQFLFFTCFMLAIDNIHMMVLSENFWHFSHSLKSGQLDFDLLKPINSIFISFFKHFRPSNFVGAICIWACLIYYGIQIQLSILSWLSLPILFILALTLLALIEFIISTAMFWLVDGFGINFLRMQFQQMARWPEFVYLGLTRKALLVVMPILLVGSGPVHFLNHNSEFEWIIYLVCAIFAMTLVLKFVWKLGLKSYESASS